MGPIVILKHVLLALGAISLLRTLLSLLHFAYTHALAPKASFSRHAGNWAVVTGASAGIGAGFARRLAARGVNVVLIARSAGKLASVADECSRAAQKAGKAVKTTVITFDFASADAAAYAKLSEEISALGNVSVLVNNVGVNVPFPTDFIETGADFCDTMVRVNVGATNRMTQMLLPAMVAAKCGAVYCLSSAGGAVSPGPLLAVYAGTKAYNDAFAVAIAGEVASSGVHVCSLTPFFVESSMAKMRASVTVPTPDSFAEMALSGTGGNFRANPHWAHAIMAAALTSLPLSIQVSYVAKLHRDIRKRALRRAERIAKQT
jgi:17beta-estradiol 17-dehydrogenase / very-long-chain 3-oxoacyl-CoA reductase